MLRLGDTMSHHDAPSDHEEIEYFRVLVRASRRQGRRFVELVALGPSVDHHRWSPTAKRDHGLKLGAS